MKSNDKKAEQLGMPIGTAAAKLRKSILFNLLEKHNENFCFQCGGEIEKEEDLSIEHKIPYLDSKDPKSLYFNLDNIAFSHLSCNCGAARQNPPTHGIASTYNTGCRCEQCRDANTQRKRKQRST